MCLHIHLREKVTSKLAGWSPCPWKWESVDHHGTVRVCVFVLVSENRRVNFKKVWLGSRWCNFMVQFQSMLCRFVEPFA